MSPAEMRGFAVSEADPVVSQAGPVVGQGVGVQEGSGVQGPGVWVPVAGGWVPVGGGWVPVVGVAPAPAPVVVQVPVSVSVGAPARSGGGSWLGRVLRVLLGALLAWLVWCGLAVAGPVWRLDSLSTGFVAPGDFLDYRVQATNVGDAPMDGSAVTVVIRLPAGLSVADPSGPVSDPSNPHYVPVGGVPGGFNFLFYFPSSSNAAMCTRLDGSSLSGGEQVVRCESTDATPSIGASTPWQMAFLPVVVGGGASGVLRTEISVSGGGAPSVSTVDPVTVSRTPPGFGIDQIDGLIADENGLPDSRAGGHPASATVSIDFNTFFNPFPLAGMAWPVEPVKDVFVDLPAGLVGAPTAAAQCTGAELANSQQLLAMPFCPTDSQVGTAVLHVNGTPSVIGPYPVFNMVPPPNVPARFGFNAVGSVVVLDGAVRADGDYGVTVKSENIPEALAVASTTVTLWGVPSATSHDLERACPGEPAPFEGGRVCRSGAPRRAFLRNPTSCPDPDVGLMTTARLDSWMNPGRFVQTTFVSHRLPGYPAPPTEWGAPLGTTDCLRVPFNPTLTATPASKQTGVPAGFQFDLSMPQTDDPVQVGQSDLRKAVVTLPVGVRVSPSSADGLGACSPQQIHLHENVDAECPESAKVGSVTVKTPLLADPLTGSVFLARQRENPFGTLLSVYLVVNGPGVVVKLAGKVETDPNTGQITTTFDDNPQLPFSNLHLEFKGGPRAPLVLPKQCGTYTTHAQLTAWSGQVLERDTSFSVSHDGNGAPCPAPPFSPGFEAGTENPVAGAASPLHLRLSRSDQDEEFAGVTVDMPDGLTGKIANVDLCPDAQARTGACPEGSRVGRVTVGAGAGTSPFYIDLGKAFLTGPYKGAPYGIAIVVPAVAGPFNLGDVVVRSAIFVDKHTAELKVVSDPLPTILEGIPLDVRDVRVAVDREKFIQNPTSCQTKTIRGTLTSTAGHTANVSARYQASDCAALPFRPRMAIRVGGAGHTNRNATTGLQTTLTMPPGSANLRLVRVTLPTTINARLTVINDACTRAEFEANNCDHARAGTAIARTPLLRDPLTGNVYFVKNGKPLPDLFISLRGDVTFDLIGRISIPGSKRLATTFDAIPDVPVSSFTLTLAGDRQNASIGAATNLCTKRGKNAKAEIDYIGQNGAISQPAQKLTINGCGKTHKTKHRTHRRARHNR